jgi:hypothetical protein
LKEKSQQKPITSSPKSSISCLSFSFIFSSPSFSFPSSSSFSSFPSSSLSFFSPSSLTHSSHISPYTPFFFSSKIFSVTFSLFNDSLLNEMNDLWMVENKETRNINKNRNVEIKENDDIKKEKKKDERMDNIEKEEEYI